MTPDQQLTAIFFISMSACVIAGFISSAVIRRVEIRESEITRRWEAYYKLVGRPELPTNDDPPLVLDDPADAWIDYGADPEADPDLSGDSWKTRRRNRDEEVW